MRFLSFILVLSFIQLSCSRDKSPINYGSDQCAHCQMMIMDKRFGAELITEKGKVYKFDAMECLINYKIDKPELSESIFNEWTNTIDSQGKLMAASDVHYIRSLNMPSPMGMYISAFSERSAALSYLQENIGTLYSWKELNKNFFDFKDLSEISEITPEK